MKAKLFSTTIFLAAFISLHLTTCAQKMAVEDYTVGMGWAKNSVNAVIFRQNAVVTYKKHQYVAYYAPDGRVVLAKRAIDGTEWDTFITPFKGNVNDAHNDISIMVDGSGYLHMSWDHHNNALHYARSIMPESLEMSEEMTMTGAMEDNVTYPQFYKMPNGNLIFMYRYGVSGNGNLVINSYDHHSQQWTRLQENLIDGEGARNAYWQACIDKNGVIHVSWVWRETWDVSTNHDLCYARSADGGKTWQTYTGESYSLPINIDNAEVAWEIPQKSSLINQTSMSADENGNPVIATYWKDDKTQKPQYQVVYCNDDGWNKKVISNRASDFKLGGGGTKKIPISRPQVMIKTENSTTTVIVVFRDEERENRPSVYVNTNFPDGDGDTFDLSKDDLGSWEPSYDTERWKQSGILALFKQKVDQVDAEGLAEAEPTEVSVLEWKP